MSAKTKKSIPAVAAVGAAALMILTGCSGGTSPGDGTHSGHEEGVFTYDSSRYGADSGALTIRIPDGLVESVQADGGEALVSEVHLTARELESSRYCAFDATISYSANALDLLTPSRQTEAEWQEKLEWDLLNQVTPYVWDQYEMMGLDVAKLSEEMSDDNLVTLDHLDEAIAAGGVLAEELQYWKNDYLSVVYKPTPVWSTLRGAEPVANLEEANPEAGIYYSSDYKTFTYIERCATSPSEDGDAEFEFPVLINDKIKELAEVELSSMQSGTITVTSAEVTGFVRDTDGNWLLR